MLQGWETWKQKEQIQLEWEEQHLGCAFDDPVVLLIPQPLAVFNKPQKLEMYPKVGSIDPRVPDFELHLQRQLAVENEARYDDDDRNRSGPLAVQDGEMRLRALFKLLHPSDFELVLEDGQNQTSKSLEGLNVV